MLRAYGGAGGGKTRRSGRGAGNGRGGTSAYTGSTWNPADKDADYTLTNNDLTATIGGTLAGAVRGTTSKINGGSANKYYFEVTVVGAGGAHQYIGLGRSTAALTGPPGVVDANAVGWLGTTGVVVINNAPQAYTPSIWGNGAVLGVTFNEADGQIRFFVNGVDQGFITGALAGARFPMVGAANAGPVGDRTMILNTAGPFVYSVPATLPWG